MVKVTLDGTELADSDNPVVLEGNYYFPPDSVRKAGLVSSDTSTTCPWKGYNCTDVSTETNFAYDPGNHSTASYYSADVDGSRVKDIGWYYANPKKEAAHIKNHVAFYKNKVVIQD